MDRAALVEHLAKLTDTEFAELVEAARGAPHLLDAKALLEREMARGVA